MLQIYDEIFLGMERLDGAISFNPKHLVYITHIFENTSSCLFIFC